MRQRGKIVGDAYKKPIELTEKYAKADKPVLFIGETGAGKERFAQFYMKTSTRPGAKMTICCAGMPHDMLWPEIFGHVKGAFTGAVEAREGYLKTCNKGILFLDELGDASPEFQATILRVSEMNSFTPLGSDKEETSVNTLIIAATDKAENITKELKRRFQILLVPPLQKYDIPALARYFLKKPLKKAILDEMMKKEYPGNVGELEKECHRLYTEKGEAIFADHDSDYFEECPPFDYDRYRREIEVWERCIQPLVKKYMLGFRYKYFPRSPSKDSVNDDIIDIVFGETPMGWTYGEAKRCDKEELNEFTKAEMKSNPRFVPGMVKLIDFLNDGIERGENSQVDFLSWFVKNLRSLFESESLPYLLETIQRVETGEPVSIVYPEISYLLELPHSEAMRRFELCYLEFHNRQFASQQDAACEAGLKPSTFSSKLHRLRKELSDVKNE
jgi:hypothetical protein